MKEDETDDNKTQDDEEDEDDEEMQVLEIDFGLSILN